MAIFCIILAADFSRLELLDLFAGTFRRVNGKNKSRKGFPGQRFAQKTMEAVAKAPVR